MTDTTPEGLEAAYRAVEFIITHGVKHDIQRANGLHYLKELYGHVIAASPLPPVQMQELGEPFTEILHKHLPDLYDTEQSAQAEPSGANGIATARSDGLNPVGNEGLPAHRTVSASEPSVTVTVKDLMLIKHTLQMCFHDCEHPDKALAIIDRVMK